MKPTEGVLAASYWHCFIGHLSIVVGALDQHTSNDGWRTIETESLGALCPVAGNLPSSCHEGIHTGNHICLAVRG